jgi:hypothetical protein
MAASAGPAARLVHEFARKRRVSFTLGVYDLFAYAIPGSVYGTLLYYVSARAGWIQRDGLDTNSFVVLVAALVGSYLLGHLTYGLSRTLGRALPKRLHTYAEARRIFVARTPEAAGRGFVEADFGLLRAAVEHGLPEATAEVSRLQATGLMLRNTSPALLLGALVALVEVVTGPEPLAAFCAAILLAAGAVAAVLGGWRLSLWANLRLLELCYWLPSVAVLDRPAVTSP